MNTLLHICCAPCANQCIDVLRTDGCAVTGYWYNPNIHPFTEYRSRRNCLRDYAASIGLPLIERNDYGLRPFVRAVAEDIDGRCVKCYSMRLYAAAHEAKEGGFDSFTSSLFISPYQNHELLREVAERAAAEYGVTHIGDGGAGAFEIIAVDEDGPHHAVVPRLQECPGRGGTVFGDGEVELHAGRPFDEFPVAVGRRILGTRNFG